jgi:MFS family permease
LGVDKTVISTQAGRSNLGDVHPAGVRAAWTAVLVLALLYGLAFVDRQIISLLVAPIRHDLGISDFQISLLQGASFGLFYSLCGLPLGFAVDRFPRRLVVFGGVVVWALAASACGLAHGFAQLLAARFLVGAGEAALAPAAYSMLSDLFPRKRLTFALSMYSIGASAGSSLSLAFGAALINGLRGGITLPLIGHLHTWQAAFIATGAPGLLIAFLVFAIPEPARGGGAAKGGGDWRELFAFLRSRGGFFTCHILGFAGVLTLAYAGLGWTPTFLSRAYGWPITQIGVVMGAMTFAAAVPSFLFSGRLVDWMFRRGITDAHFRFYVVATVVCGGAGMLAFQSKAPWLFFVLYAVSAVGLNMAGVAAGAVQIATPPALRGRVSALYLMISSLLAMSLGPSTVAFFTDYVFHNDAKLGASVSATYLVFAPIALAAFLLGLKPMRRAVALAAAGFDD